jgi:hypothetical protein
MEAFLTLHFLDGSKLKFQFDVQGNEAARKIKLDQFMTSRHLVVEAEGSVMIFPVANIKYMTLSPPAGKPALAALPRHAIVGASIRD